jgi:hypothetical protein
MKLISILFLALVSANAWAAGLKLGPIADTGRVEGCGCQLRPISKLAGDKTWFFAKRGTAANFAMFNLNGKDVTVPAVKEASPGKEAFKSDSHTVTVEYSGDDDATRASVSITQGSNRMKVPMTGKCGC